ncbi:hypothetical protein SAMN02745911_1216 [Aureimonas altamirensis DSM 21988]|uniref:Uncharacterized protein n=2 Tax=Aureimonas altamirensis TaxID=370622 RepID=A0A0P0YX79_9HYPH|nr:hypothetical protein [Aureimonas altamirensis]BAT26071.1 hypothetical protein [Aureimonas altamirensis]SHI80285.1 hypothetical protein SAMN02745911_1216 [Aureimonas altamirensis DSM 21988]
MRRIGIAGLIALAGITSAVAQDDPRDRALAAVNEEQSVVEALWSTYRTMWVSMRDDGSNRRGFAEYLCLVLNDYDLGEGSIRVRIFDAGAMARGEQREIGEATC